MAQATLRASKGEKIYLFSHYPPFICSADEEDHYDNYAEPGRAWLLGLLPKLGLRPCSRVMSTISLPTHTKVWRFIAIRPGFTRQDYAALFDGPVAPEFGRDDGDKFGVTMVDVTAEGHDFRFQPTFGRSLKRGRPCQMMRLPRSGISHSSHRISAMIGPASNQCPITALWRNSAVSRRATIIRYFG